MTLLYHYTGATGLKGIISGNSLWATSYLFRNDSSELIYGLRQFCSHLIQLAKNSGHEFPISPVALAEQVRGPLVRSAHPFSVSFCRHSSEQNDRNGLLSQWRAYGSDGGYAIGFDEPGLVERCKMYAAKHIGDGSSRLVGWFMPSECSYENYTPPDDIKENGRIYRFIESLLSSEVPEDQDDRESNWELLKEATRVGLFFKHADFYEEREFRIAYGLLKHGKFPDLSFDVRNGAIYPYMQLFGDMGVNDLIQVILVGPHPDRNRRVDSLQMLLAQCDLEVPVVCSSTPLRK